MDTHTITISAKTEDGACLADALACLRRANWGVTLTTGETFDAELVCATSDHPLHGEIIEFRLWDEERQDYLGARRTVKAETIAALVYL
jgi:hypothetical protein